MRILITVGVLLVACDGLDNGLGLKPQLGFNSWNSFETLVNETVMKMTMDAFVSLGLRDAGYEYVSMVRV
jgi:alpha-galactosidase